ncbi:Nose resistant to fluoxetine protein 6 [Araneus ventricosus]|uniref:Nose resistant to fluoxetine protein 6 n=1 Tax=Araneus ventricosus TaxID=182803 RepID=A0A4Y2P1H9_ARAVE|nr:Nose resistant to fluoxetine protein 6 [Araneus ventricosus]
MYFIVLGFYSTLFRYLGSGPVWPTYNTNPVCKENWMWHVLFINNFNSHMRQCLTPTWYLACEMQLYIISPIFLILLMRRTKIGYVLIFLCIYGSCFINFIFTKQYELIDGPARLAEYYSTDLKDFQRRFWKYFDILYTKPYSRLGTFLIGIALGYYLFQKKATTIKKKNQVMLSLGWIMAAIFMWISLFALYGREESVLETAVYNGLKHLLFSISVAWIIFVCVTGQGGFFNRFLSSKIFIVISRLSYTIYLTHMVILEGYFLAKKDLIDHSMGVYGGVLTMVCIIFFLRKLFLIEGGAE